MRAVDASVAPSTLTEQAQRFGSFAFAITANEEAKSHVVSVTAGWQGDEIVFAAGPSTSRNVETSGLITLLWPAPALEPYSLIVDGQGEVGDGSVVVRPTRAVLHRVAGADSSLPSCVKLLDG